MRLKEEWADSFKTLSKTVEVFVNPTQKEFNEVKNNDHYGVRWLADSKTKKVYIHPSNSAIHGTVINKVILKGKSEEAMAPHFTSDRWISGSVTKTGHHFSDLLDAGYWWKDGYGKKAIKKDWSWAYKYIPGMEKFIEKYKGNVKEDIMKIDSLLNNMLTESGIRIPKGTRAAKVIYHQDMDGVMSALLTVNQLVKQGISKDRIKLSSIHDRDNNEAVKKKLAASKGQMVALVDFARIPKEGMRKPDFWSDHHVMDEPEKTGSNIKKDVSSAEYKTKAKRPYPKHGIKKGDEIIIDPKTGKKYSERTFNIVQTRSHKTSPYKHRTGKIKKNVHRFEIQEAVGKTDYPSEAEHLATVHAQNLMTGKDIRAISNVDSANYSNLKDLIDLPKSFRKKGRMERLAIITNLLLGKMLTSNPTAINQLIKQANPSLVSVYTTLLKLAKLNDKQATAIRELGKANPNYALVSKTKAELPPEMAKEVSKEKSSKSIKKLKSLEQTRATRKEEIKKQTDPKTTQFKKGNEYVIIQTSKPGSSQPQRFTGSLLTKQSGERYPAMMREWGNMFQISLNPSLKMADKEKVNLTKGVDKILGDVIRDVNNGTIKVRDKGMTKWALTKVIRPEAGGHAGITTVGGLATLGLAPKSIREDLKKLYEYEKRVKALKGKKTMSDIMPKSAAKMAELKKIKADFGKEREMIIAEIKKRILDGVAKAMETRGVEMPKGSERFKVKTRKPSIKESIQYRNKNWRT